MKKQKIPYLTFLIITGVLILNIYQMSPSPILNHIRDYYGLVKSEALLNLSVSIIFPSIIFSSLVGTYIGQKIGTAKLYSLSLFLSTLGILLNFLAGNYPIFLAGRAIFGLGLGLTLPFMGSTIMSLYKGKSRSAMSTVNSLFPFVGSLICFVSQMRIFYAFGNSVRISLGIWSLGSLVILLVWTFSIKNSDLEVGPTNPRRKSTEKGLYLNLMKRKEIRLLATVFICDFFCHSYVSVVLPTYLHEMAHLSETSSGLWAGLTIQGIGIAGCLGGGYLASKLNQEKKVLAFSISCKIVGSSIFTLFAGHSPLFILAGIVIFAIGSGTWYPVVFLLPARLKDMTPVRVGAAFGLLTSCALVSGFISPIIGGLLTDGFIKLSSLPTALERHAFGLQWSLFIIGLVNVIALVGTLRFKQVDYSEEYLRGLLPAGEDGGLSA